MFPSLTAAVQQMVAERMSEVDVKKEELLAACEKARARAKAKDCKDDEEEDRWLGNISWPRSVAQQLIFECPMSDSLKWSGRKKWFPDAKLARMIVVFHLRDVDPEKQPLLDTRHNEWLKQCREDFTRWTSALTSYSVAAPKGPIQYSLGLC
jgi:hypothetical protein